MNILVASLSKDGAIVAPDARVNDLASNTCEDELLKTEIRILKKADNKLIMLYS